MPQGIEQGMYLERSYEIQDLRTFPDKEGEMEALVSAFNVVDSYGTKMAKGAFAKSIRTKLPKGVWMHDYRLPVAKTLSAKETDEGLVVRGLFNLETTRGREAYSDVKNGLIDEFSIGFRVENYEYDKKQDVFTFTQVRVYEWSPVLVGANPKTALIGIRSEGIGNSYRGETEQVLDLLDRYLARAQDYLSIKEEDGRPLSLDRRSDFEKVRDALNEILRHTPSKADQVRELEILRAQSLDIDLSMKEIEAMNQ